MSTRNTDRALAQLCGAKLHLERHSVDDDRVEVAHVNASRNRVILIAHVALESAKVLVSSLEAGARRQKRVQIGSVGDSKVL